MIQRVSVLAPLQWVTAAANAGTRNPRVLIAGASTLVTVVLGLLLLASAVLGSVLGQGGASTPDTVDADALMAASWPLMLVALMIPQFVIAGLAHLVHRVETSDAPRVSDAFAGFRKGRVLSLCGLVVIPLATVALTLAAYGTLGGADYMQDYWAMLQAAMAGQMVTPPQPAHPFLLMLASLALNWVSYAMQLFAPIHVMLSGRGTFAAIGDCLRAFARNLPAMVFAGVLGFAAMIAVFLLMALAMLLGAVLIKVLPLLGSILAAAILLALAVLGVLFWVACGYFGWRAMFAAEIAPATPEAGGVAM